MCKQIRDYEDEAEEAHPLRIKITKKSKRVNNDKLSFLNKKKPWKKGRDKAKKLNE